MGDFMRGVLDYCSHKEKMPLPSWSYTLGYDSARRVNGDPSRVSKRAGLDALATVRAALHTGQFSCLKQEAQVSLERIERVLRAAQKAAREIPEAGSLRAVLRDEGLLE